MRLNELQTGQKAIIVKILGHGAFRKRLIEMGFVKGHTVEVLLHAPLRDPIKYRVMDYEVSLRCSEAHLIEIIPVESPDDIDSSQIQESGIKTSSEHIVHSEVFNTHRRVINVALIGNPNCGKTSLFNIASGAHEHVGNYSGVTVDAKAGTFTHGGYTFNIVDLPGTYSLDTGSYTQLRAHETSQDL
ncbi:MAG: FeoA domain-containing protein, partial [Paramuribaculum sp.]|nr:FeoA domain-containing protein [Paramuribaculum sp.]